MSTTEGSPSRREQRRERHQGAKTLVKGGGPSRLRNKRQEKIVSMIDGYDSIMTLSTAMSALFLLWIIPALGLLAVGALGIAARGTDGNADSIEAFNSALGAVQGAQSLMTVATGALFVYWAFRARENVRRLGKRHRIGIADILIRRVKAIIVGFLALVIGFFVPVASIVVVAVGIVIGTSIFVAYTFHTIAYATMQMLWRTSSPPVGLENAMPHVGLVWIWAWVIYGILFSFTQNPSGEDVVLSAQQLGLIAMAQGIFLLIAVAAAARMVMGVAIRQEERLGVIISYIDNDAPDEEDAKVVTTDQIQSAWDDSDRFVSFNQ